MNKLDWLRAAGAALVGLVASSCQAQPVKAVPSTQMFAPAATRTLRDFGAVGNGQADDTAAILRALKSSDQYCLDGQGRTYRVVGTIRVQKDLCLRNATLVQSLPPFDTTPYVSRDCGPIRDPHAVADCGDPAIPANRLSELAAALGVRTLFIRSDEKRPLRVNLSGVKVDRGRYPEAGARAESAGIWITGARRIDLTNVEITGYGKGYGLHVVGSQNLNFKNLSVHDLVWAPYRGEAPLTEERIGALGWNAAPIHEFRAAGRDGAGVGKFYGVRVQEQISCVVLTNVQHVRITNARVERCMAQFAGANLPWQADGLDFNRSSSDIVVDGATISDTYNGIDVVANGDGVDGLVLNNLRINNSFSYGLKMGVDLRNATITNPVITNSGLAGIIIHGQVRNVRISGASVLETGAFDVRGRSFSPWRPGQRAGISISQASRSAAGGVGTPNGISIENSTVSNRVHPQNVDFGLLNRTNAPVRIVGFRAEGYSRAPVQEHGRPD